MINVFLHQSFFDSVLSLPKTQQSKISKFIKQFQENPAHSAINLHSVGDSMLDDRILGARLDEAYRVIVLPSENGMGYVLVYVNKHDLAYNWAKTKRFEFKNKNGFFQISDKSYIESSSKSEKNIFDSYNDKELYDAGIDEQDIETVRRIKSKEDLIQVIKYFDPLVQSVLSLMADGVKVNEALEKSITEISIPQQEINEDETNSEASIQTIVDEKTLTNLDIVNADKIIKFDKNLDWNQIFSESIDQWRIFLHPAQKSLVRRKFSGPLQITGSAGTGKTVVLLHRAVRFVKENPQDKVLFLTFTANLTIEIRSLLLKLLKFEEVNPSLINNIEVTSLYRFAENIIKKTGWNGSIVARFDERVTKIWNQLTDTIPSEFPLTKEELISEYYEIKEQKGIFELDSYLTSIRQGKSRLAREGRKQIWNFFEKFEAELRRRSLRTPEQAIHESRLYLEKNKALRYSHVFVDEIQDMSVEALKLIRIISSYEENKANGITLAGDLNQRIYRSSYQPNHAGILLKGRSVRLRVNYRTTEQIREFADSLLNERDETLNKDWNESNFGDISTHLGPRPELYHPGIYDDVVSKIKLTVDQWTAEGVLQNEICIIYSDGQQLAIEHPLEKLRRAALPIFELTAFQEDRADIPGFRLGSIKRTKGLEFRCVILIVSIGKNYISRIKDLSLFDRCELYVGSTRARERLVVID